MNNIIDTLISWLNSEISAAIKVILFMIIGFNQTLDITERFEKIVIRFSKIESITSVERSFKIIIYTLIFFIFPLIIIIISWSWKSSWLFWICQIFCWMLITGVLIAVTINVFFKSKREAFLKRIS